MDVSHFLAAISSSRINKPGLALAIGLLGMGLLLGAGTAPAATRTLDSLLSGDAIVAGDWIFQSFTVVRNDATVNGTPVDATQVSVTDIAQPGGAVELGFDWNGELHFSGVGSNNYQVTYSIQHNSLDIDGAQLETLFVTDAPDPTSVGAVLRDDLLLDDLNPNGGADPLVLDNMLDTTTSPHTEVSSDAGTWPNLILPSTVLMTQDISSTLDAGSTITNEIDTSFHRFRLTPDPVDLTGTVEDQGGTPLCSLVLAVGQFMFTCNPNGPYELLDLPTEADGTVKRQVYVDGFLPNVETLTGSTN